MNGKDWNVTDEGQCSACPTPRGWDLLETPYRFHRFLTDMEDVLRPFKTDAVDDCLPNLRRLVRKLVLNSYWLQTQRPELASSAKTAVLNLYDEIGYPLTVQIEMYLPGAKSPVHNHGTWGIVAVLQGQESNVFWQRSPVPTQPDKITQTATRTLTYGDVISFAPAAIHSIQAVGEVPLVTFNIYGETHSKQRFEFDPNSHTAKHY
jgi:predicted metal-dependent enzyme (double-stranded beta helix superfamily)